MLRIKFLLRSPLYTKKNYNIATPNFLVTFNENAVINIPVLLFHVYYSFTDAIIITVQSRMSCKNAVTKYELILFL
jgi:hypothetical protein